LTRYQIGLGGSDAYPFGVDFVPENLETPMYFWEGLGHMNAGGLFTAGEALTEPWRSHLETAGAVWFVPFLERLARGERVGLPEVFEAYRFVHGAKAVMPMGS
jgi:hypothetical protein